MTKEEILEALHLTAIGRRNYPVQEQFAEKLAALMESPEQRATREMMADAFEALAADKKRGKAT